jgi:hypothetical protein
VRSPWPGSWCLAEEGTKPPSAPTASMTANEWVVYVEAGVIVMQRLRNHAALRAILLPPLVSEDLEILKIHFSVPIQIGR